MQRDLAILRSLVTPPGSPEAVTRDFRVYPIKKGEVMTNPPLPLTMEVLNGKNGKRITLKPNDNPRVPVIWCGGSPENLPKCSYFYEMLGTML